VELKQELRKRGARISGGSKKADLIEQLFHLLRSEHLLAEQDTSRIDHSDTLDVWEAENRTRSSERATDSSVATLRTARSPVAATARLDQASVHQAWTGDNRACLPAAANSNQAERAASEDKNLREGQNQGDCAVGERNTSSASHISSAAAHASDSEGDPWDVEDFQPPSTSTTTATAVSVPTQFYDLGGPYEEKKVCLWSGSTASCLIRHILMGVGSDAPCRKTLSCRPYTLSSLATDSQCLFFGQICSNFC
jgi:hypothetical protein